MQSGPAWTGNFDVTFSPCNGEEVFLCLESHRNRKAQLIRR